MLQLLRRWFPRPRRVVRRWIVRSHVRLLRRCQQRLGLPCEDAFDTSSAIESRLLQAQRVVQLAELAEQKRLQDEAVSASGVPAVVRLSFSRPRS